MRLASICAFAALLLLTSFNVADAAFIMVASNGGLLRLDAQTGQVLSDTSGAIHQITIGTDGNVYAAIPAASQIGKYDINTGAYLGSFSHPGLDIDPHGVAMGPDGNLYASMGNDYSVLEFNGQTGQLLGTFVQPNSGLYVNAAITFGPNGNLFGITHGNAGIVMQYDGTTGASLGNFTQNAPYGVGGMALTFGPNGDLFETSEYLNAVLRYSGTTGQFEGYFATGGGLSYAGGLAFGPDGNLYVGSIDTGQILEYNGTTGAYMGVFADNVGGVTSITFAETAAVPEPASLVLTLIGAVTLVGWRRRSR